MKAFILNHRWKLIILVSGLFLVGLVLLMNKPQNPDEIIVYVTKTGAKYHRSGCRSLLHSKIPLPLSQAVKNYTPCHICNPPKINKKNLSLPIHYSGKILPTTERHNIPLVTVDIFELGNINIFDIWNFI
jgi:hypothetical protein